jgi:hypothetical protein
MGSLRQTTPILSLFTYYKQPAKILTASRLTKNWIINGDPKGLLICFFVLNQGFSSEYVNEQHIPPNVAVAFIKQSKQS